MASAFVRCGLAVGALIAGAWLVVSLRSVELEEDGRAVLSRAQSGPISLSEVRRGQSFLHRAGRFSADKGPAVYESLLLRTAGRRDEAAVVAERVVAEEPDNFQGWSLVYLTSRDRGRAAEALRNVRVLNPWAADELRSAR